PWLADRRALSGLAESDPYRAISELLPESIDARRRETLVRVLMAVARATDAHETARAFSDETDTLGRCLMNIHHISSALGQSLPWLKALWQDEIVSEKIESLVEVLPLLRPDAMCRDVIDALRKAQQRIAAIAPLDMLPRNRIQNWLLRIPTSDPEAKIETAMCKAESGESELARIRREVGEVIGGLRHVGTCWSSTHPQPDGAVAHEHRRLLQILLESFNVLRHDEIRRACVGLASVSVPGKCTRSAIGSMLGTDPKMSEIIERVMTESYVPVFPRLGLQMRHILLRRTKSPTPTRGLVEAADTGNPRLRRLLGYVEPVTSGGPSGWPREDFVQTVTHTLVQSFRWDLFDPTSGEWREPWLAEPSDVLGGTDTGLAQPSVDTPLKLSARDVDTLGLLWGLDGTHAMRERLLGELVVPRRSRSLARDRLIRGGAVTVNYHPRLEYTGLWDGIFVMVSSSSLADGLRFQRWLVAVSPYIELSTSDRTGDMAALVRVPRGQALVLRGRCEEVAGSLQMRCITCSLRTHRTYRASALSRLFDRRSHRWTDPWATRRLDTGAR
ncbi:MAG: hypothetical protein QXQ81_07055, partial [Candidatus Thorarchaeota archaeon]